MTKPHFQIGACAFSFWYRPIRSLLLVYLVGVAAGSCSNPEHSKEGSRLTGLFEESLRESDTEIIKQLRRSRKQQQPLALYKHYASKRPKDAADKLRREGFKVRQHAPFAIIPPINWGADPYKDRNWRFQLNALYPIQNAIQVYESSGSLEYLEFSERIFLDWIDFNISSDKENNMKWYDMATGIRATVLAYIIDQELRRKHLSSEDIVTFLLAAEEHAKELEDPAKLSIGNHAYFQLAGLMALCKALPTLRKCDERKKYATDTFVNVLATQFNNEGIHLEHSPSYHAYAVDVLAKFMALEWFDFGPSIQENFEEAKENIYWMVRPDGEFTRVGDSAGTLLARLAKYHETAVYAQTNGKKGKRPEETYKVFPKGGYAVVRHPAASGNPSNDGYVFLTVAHHSPVHKHRDSLSFEWHDLGLPILVDGGKYAYEKNEHRNFFLSTRSHNTLEVDEQDLDTGKPGCCDVDVDVLSDDDAVYVIQAQKRHAKLGVMHRRHVVYEPGHWLLVVDELDSEEPHEYKQWFHLHPSWRRRGKENVWVAGKSVLRAYPLGVKKISVVRGQKEPRLQGWFSEKYAQYEENDALLHRETGKRARIATLFVLGDRPSAPPKAKLEFSSAVTRLCWGSGAELFGAAVDQQAHTVRSCD